MTNTNLIERLRQASKRDVFELAYKAADKIEEAAALIEQQEATLTIISQALIDACFVIDHEYVNAVDGYATALLAAKTHLGE